MVENGTVFGILVCSGGDLWVTQSWRSRVIIYDGVCPADSEESPSYHSSKKYLPTCI